MKNIQRIRKATGMSQSQLAQASGVAIRMIQSYEQGSKDINRAEGLRLYHLAQALSCTIEDLLELPPVQPSLSVTQALLLFAENAPHRIDQCLEIVRHIELGDKELFSRKGAEFIESHMEEAPNLPLDTQDALQQVIAYWTSDRPTID